MGWQGWNLTSGAPGIFNNWPFNILSFLLPFFMGEVIAEKQQLNIKIEKDRNCSTRTWVQDFRFQKDRIWEEISLKEILHHFPFWRLMATHSAAGFSKEFWFSVSESLKFTPESGICINYRLHCKIHSSVTKSVAVKEDVWYLPWAKDKCVWGKNENW